MIKLKVADSDRRHFRHWTAGLGFLAVAAALLI